MELKYAISGTLWEVSRSFNRTFMELKSMRPAAAGYEKHRFNRTFMELK